MMMFKSIHASSALIIQPKLALGPVDDPFEREADQMAEQVTRGNGRSDASPASLVQPILQRQSLPAIANSTAAVTPQVESAIQQAGGGQTLPSTTRAPMEQAMGFDFSKVRIHTDRHADQLNRSLTARAFTTGQDIFFKEGEYQPGSGEGQKLLAHELTHVVQQSYNTNVASTTNIQRQTLDEIYGERVQDDEDKQNYLADFKRIQTLLKNEQGVLNILKENGISQDNVEARLSEFEAGSGFSVARPTLINFVPPDFFLSILSNTQPFEDLLETVHGVQTHRLQWYVISKDMAESGGYHQTLPNLYRAAGDKFWKYGNKYMWDEVVDRMDYEFGVGSPERFTDLMSKGGILSSLNQQDVLLDNKKNPLLELWDSYSEKELSRNTFDQVEVGDYIFTGFDDNIPSVVYRKEHQEQIPHQ